MRLPSDETRKFARSVALQIGLSVVSTVAVKYGTDAAVRGIERVGSRFKKKRPIGFVR